VGWKECEGGCSQELTTSGLGEVPVSDPLLRPRGDEGNFYKQGVSCQLDVLCPTSYSVVRKEHRYDMGTTRPDGSLDTRMLVGIAEKMGVESLGEARSYLSI